MKKSGALVGLAFALLLLVVMDGVTANRIVNVGGREGWKSGVNYTRWVSQQEAFHVGDWLMFKFEKYMYDIVEVNKTCYENCQNDCIIANLTRGADRDMCQLTEARPYYFICTRGYCYNGMKFAINVSEPLPPTPSPKGNDAGLSLNARLNNLMALLLLCNLGIGLFLNV